MIRRLTSIAAVVVALPVAIVTAPLWMACALAADVLGRLWRFPTLRLGLFGVIYLVHQWVALGCALWLGAVERIARRSTLTPYREVQSWWAASLLRSARRLLGVDFDIDDLSTMPEESFVILSRHASMVDAILPIVLVTGHLRRFVHYVLKDELLWDPAIATFGLKLGNWFVARGSQTEGELEGIANLAAEAQPGSVLVIFPEGTYATPRNRRQVIDSLRRKAGNGELDPEVVAYAENLNHLLPPKPAGSLTLLSALPEADVVVLGHVGLEGVAELRGLRRRLPLEQPVVLSWWRHRRHELPNDVGKLEDWIQQEWAELDRWVTETTSRRAGSKT